MKLQGCNIITELDYGIAALVLAHNDKIGMSCERCNADFMKENNCLYLDDFNEDNDSVFYSPELDIEFTTCPISCITRPVIDLYDKWQFNKEFNPGLTEKNTPALLWHFIKKYNQYDNMVKLYENKKGGK